MLWKGLAPKKNKKLPLPGKKMVPLGKRNSNESKFTRNECLLSFILFFF